MLYSARRVRKFSQGSQAVAGGRKRSQAVGSPITSSRFTTWSLYAPHFFSFSSCFDTCTFGRGKIPCRTRCTTNMVLSNHLLSCKMRYDRSCRDTVMSFWACQISKEFCHLAINSSNDGVKFKYFTSHLINHWAFSAAHSTSPCVLCRDAAGSSKSSLLGSIPPPPFLLHQS